MEVELVDGARFVLSRIDPEPGFGMVTLCIAGEDDDAPDVILVPVGSIKRVELRQAPEERVASFGFAVQTPKE